MQRFSAYLGVVAMLVALATAPLYHSHDHDDHGEPASLVHAHLWNTHAAESHPDDEIEAPDHDHQARWVDVFTFQAPSDAFVLEIDLTQDVAVPILEQSRGVTLPSVPRAHSPPAARLLAPRPPPTL